MMIARRMAIARWIVAVACVVTATQHMATSHFAEEPPVPEKAVEKSTPPSIDDENRVPVAVARDRAKVMHDIYSATLDTIHHRYFHRDTAVIPARAMEDVFAEMKRNSQVEARWIAVNLRAMSIDHEPETEFEKQAARVIGGGQSEFEQIEGGYYRRATAIPLVNGCIACHEGSFRQPTKAPKFAGLVISIPVATEAASAPAAVAP
ncbi:MAG: DUF3365 domain-containing protein [Planctomycetota bacterium]|nr:MAG: DUF3365 domain-containing protein [Planctomycetota bacterium]